MATNTEHQAEFRRRMKERGIAQITVWAPIRERERLKKYAAKLLRVFEREQKPTDGGNSGKDAE